MGSLIHYEGWDGATAPSIPAGWTVSAPLATSSSPTGGISPLSSPNVLACATSGSNTHYPATYSVADAAGGNVLVYASFTRGQHDEQPDVRRLRAGRRTRSSSPARPITGHSSHRMLRRASSTPSSEARRPRSARSSATLSDDVWYQVQLNCQQSTITVTVVRASDGYFLTSAGNWQAAGAIAISVTDSSVTGSGYAGLTLQSRSDNAYSDEWYFYGYSAITQAGPVRTLPIVQRAAARGQVIQPRAVRFGTPVVPLLAFSHGIVWRDLSRRRASIDHGSVWMPVPARISPPLSLPFAVWKTVRWIDPSQARRRATPGRAAAPQSFARLAPQVPMPFAHWQTIRWIDPSLVRRRIAPGRVWNPGARSSPDLRSTRAGPSSTSRASTRPVQYGSEILLSWTSSAPPGLVFQVYENDVLVWHGTSTYCTLPLPQSLARFDIGTVGFTQETVEFSSMLPPAPRSRPN